MKRITNEEEDMDNIQELSIEEGDNEEKTSSMDKTHDVKIGSNRLIKLAEECKIPIFIAYYDPQKGYQYDGVLPEEVQTTDSRGQYGKFIEFMKICIGFNKEEHVAKVCRKTLKSNTDIDEDTEDTDE